MDRIQIAITEPSEGYSLLDSGDGEKLESYGGIILSRPDPQALWKKSSPEKQWASAAAKFSRDDKNSGWIFAEGAPKEWTINFGGLKLIIKPTAFKHTGLFPEQLPNWMWLKEILEKTARPANVLNLFGYTGGATLSAALAGANVTHVDASKAAVNWARKNSELSGLKSKPIRWIVDDVMLFLKREIKRGNLYDGIIMDPPAFGHGPKGELWKIENDLPTLFDLCQLALSESPIFFLVNGYASGYSSIAYQNNLSAIFKGRGGETEIGELAIRETESKRLLPAGIFARWRKSDL